MVTQDSITEFMRKLDTAGVSNQHIFSTLCFMHKDCNKNQFKFLVSLVREFSYVLLIALYFIS